MPAPETTEKTERTEQTRDAIVSAARARFQHYGFKKTTIDEIAADAGVGKGTVYLYFDGKEELLLTIALEVKRNITAQIRAIQGSLSGPEEKLRRILLASLLSVYDAYSNAAHGCELVDEVRPWRHERFCQDFQQESEEQRRIVASVLQAGDAANLFTVDDAPRTAQLLFQAFAAYYPPYACPSVPQARCRAEFEKGAREMLDFVLRGLLRR